MFCFSYRKQIKILKNKREENTILEPRTSNPRMKRWAIPPDRSPILSEIATKFEKNLECEVKDGDGEHSL